MVSEQDLSNKWGELEKTYGLTNSTWVESEFLGQKVLEQSVALDKFLRWQWGHKKEPIPHWIGKNVRQSMGESQEEVCCHIFNKERNLHWFARIKKGLVGEIWCYQKMWLTKNAKLAWESTSDRRSPNNYNQKKLPMEWLVLLGECCHLMHDP